MEKSAIWKWLILIVLVAGSMILVYPPKDKIRLGLDLKGGTSFVVKIDEETIREQVKSDNPSFDDQQVAAEIKKRLEGAQERALEVIRNRVDGLGISEPIIYPGKDNRIVIQLPGIGEEKRKEAEKSIMSVAFLEFRLVHKKNTDLIDQLFEKNKCPEGYRIEHIGNENVYVRDTKAVRDSAMDKAFRKRQAQFGQDIVKDTRYEFMLEKDLKQNLIVFKPHFVERRPELTGNFLETAGVDYRTLGQAVVDLTFDSKGAKKFANITSDYAPGGAKNPDPNKFCQLAIILDGTLYSAPVIREAIHGGRAEISGNFKAQDAMFLANILKAGSLPAPVMIIEQRVVDPTLGADSIKSGVSAGLYGCIAIIVLMAMYYMIPGLLADFALCLNVVLLPLGMIIVAGCLDVFSGGGRGSASAIALPVLTLPGIAGIALSIGMAVDANVLIFERIREELRAGKAFTGAIQAGYERAFTAIFDSNITTIITAVILFILGGAGPIRGYAVTLTAGLLVSLYTAVVVTRMCFDAIAAKTTSPKLLNMVSLIRMTNIDFMKIWKIPSSISVIIIVASWALMISHGLKDPKSVFGVDFTGGSAMTLSIKDKPPIEDVRAALSAAGVKDAGLQYQGAMPGAAGDEVLQVKVSNTNEAAIVQKVLPEKFPKAEMKPLQADDVGPQIGKEMKTKAAWAMGWSLIAMIIYIWWRFELGFGLGAVVALFHDVLITAGIVHLLGFQMNMTIVAALMTIVGYSVNDTIVIFDRIREDLRLMRNKSFTEICNLGMNQTLARTLLTNFLTFISVLCLVIFGGGSIRDFAITMFIGMIAGTYSTIYIATPVVLMWYGFKTPDLGSAKTVVK